MKNGERRLWTLEHQDYCEWPAVVKKINKRQKEEDKISRV